MSQDNSKSIFLAAIEECPRDQWEAYVKGACGDDQELRARVEELLKAHADLGTFHDKDDGYLPTQAYAVPTEKAGEVIGPYKLLQEIGQGGFGVVYMAEQQEPVQRKVALKIIKPGMDTREVIARFEAERQALAMMDHSNIARVLDAGATEAGRPYFVMELVRGIPITKYCDQGNLTTRERLDLFVITCQAVQHAHQKGIIHRDIKPSNVMITLHDGTPVVKVIDFGIAKAINQKLTEKTLFTSYAQMIGTPLYMSPEQAELSGLDVDTRTDVYSLGVLLYELLTGATPFDKQRLSEAAYDEIRRIIREEEPPKPSTRLSTVLGEFATDLAAHRSADPRKLSALMRGDLDWIVMKALDKDRSRRYETASGFAADIERFLNEQPIEACPPSARYRFHKFARRNRVALATVTVVVASLVLGVAGTTWQAIRATSAFRAESYARNRADDARQRAIEQRDEADAARKRAEANLRIATDAVDGVYLQAAERWLHAGQLARKTPKEESLRMTLRFYEALARQDSLDRHTRYIEARASYRAGLILYELGQQHDSQNAILRSRSELHQLGQEFPDVLKYQQGEVACDAWLGGLWDCIANPDREKLDRAANKYEELARIHNERFRDQAPRPDHDHRGLIQSWICDCRGIHELNAAEIHLCIGISVRQDRRLAKEQLSVALDLYQKAISLYQRRTDPLPVATALNGLAATHEAMSRFALNDGDLGRVVQEVENAEKAWGSAIEHDPDYAWGRFRWSHMLTFHPHQDVRAPQRAYELAERSVRLVPDRVEYQALLCITQRRLAWNLSTSPDAKQQSADQAIELARSAVKNLPIDAGLMKDSLHPSVFWQTFGVACYRGGRWQLSIDSLNQSRRLRGSEDPVDAYILAMSHWHLEDSQTARRWYNDAIDFEKSQQSQKDVLRFRAEAEALLGVSPESEENSRDVEP